MPLVVNLFEASLNVVKPWLVPSGLKIRTCGVCIVLFGELFVGRGEADRILPYAGVLNNRKPLYAGNTNSRAMQRLPFFPSNSKEKRPGPACSVWGAVCPCSLH